MGGNHHNITAGRKRPFSNASHLQLLACAALLVLFQLPIWAFAADGEPTMRLNPTGRVLMMPVPLMDGTDQLGELVARIEPDDTILIQRNTLIRLLGKRLRPAVIEAIRKLPAKAGQITTTALAATGARLSFDQADVALKFEPKAELRTAKTISIGRVATSVPSSQRADPAKVSGYVNVTAGAEHLWAGSHTKARSSLHLDVQSSLRAGKYVVEHAAGYDGAIDANTCPRNAVCNYQHNSGLKRRSTRVIYDMPKRRIRVQTGDTTTRPAGFQRVGEILGVAVEKSNRLLQPDASGRPTTAHSFLVEKPSQAEIKVNGAVVRRLRLRPGTYDLNGLALATGSNNVEILLTDDTGASRTIHHSTYFDRRLLSPGETEWSVAGGVPSYYRNGAREYLDDGYVASGYYRLGLNDRLTGEVNAQADKNAIMAGGSALTATAWGFFSTRAALSLADIGPGFAIGANWDLLNFGTGAGGSGSLGAANSKRSSLRFAAEYRSDDFVQPGQSLNIASGVIYPTHEYWLSLSGSFSTSFIDGVSTTLSGRYQFGKDEMRDPYSTRGDRYGADVTFSGAVTENVNGSVSLGYSNESITTGSIGREREPEFRVTARAFIRLGNKTNISASHDSLNRQSIVTGYHRSGEGVGRWEASVDAYNNGHSKEATFGGSTTYYGNRLEARVAHNSSLSDLTWNSLTAEPGQQRSSARFGTSLVYADGKFAWGAPVRGGYAIVYPHASLKDKTVTVGTKDNIRGKADAWGPAVISNLPAYAQTTLAIDVDDLPLGYSLGTGTFDLRAPYGAGYALKVGSGYSVSAYGTLVDTNGAPLKLLSGVVYPVGDRAREATIITNAGGRFAAEGLA